MAKALVNSLAASWDPAKYTDQYRENLMRIIKGKMKGKKVALEAGGRAAAGGGRRSDGAAAPQPRAGAPRAPGARNPPKKRHREADTGRVTDSHRSALSEGCGIITPVTYDLRPMLASLADAPLDDPQLVYEPKYDGIRAIVEIAPSGRVRLWSRLGNEKTRSFRRSPRRSRQWARRLKQPLVLDGEIVALDANGEPTGFQTAAGTDHLASRLTRSRTAPPLPRSRPSPSSPSICCATARPTCAIARCSSGAPRSSACSRRTQARRSLRISEQVRGDGRALYKRALDQGWEGLIAKHADSRYQSGKRTPDWRKLKIVHEQEFVIGGWTEPRADAHVLRRAAARRLRRRQRLQSPVPAPVP